jgi:predicted RND superfamily exporter protein
VRATLLVGGALLLGVATMTAGSLLAGIKINFFNFVALPTTFGIGVDYLVNVYARYDLERARARPADPALAGPGPVERVLWTTGGAVVLCSATTIIGYATLLIADNRALVSFGAFAAIGEITCLAAALVVLPACLALLDRRAG